MDKDLEKLFDEYEGNLLNYFSGLTPEQSKKFNEMQKKKKDVEAFKFKEEVNYDN